jgi:hypothetical protein
MFAPNAKPEEPRQRFGDADRIRREKMWLPSGERTVVTLDARPQTIATFL